MEKEKEILSTYVLLSPYCFQNNRKVEIIAKYGSLLFATSYFICMVLFHLNSRDNLWVLFLPQFIFYSIAFIFLQIYVNKTFLFMQIMLTFIFIPYGCYLTIFVRKNFESSYGLSVVSLFTVYAMLIYPTILHIDYRKHYAKNLSTAESVSTLNTIDFVHSLFLVVCVFVTIPLTELLKISLPLYLYRTPRDQEIPVTYFSGIGIFIWICVFIFEMSICVALYLFVSYSNQLKCMASLNNVEIDVSGRAWYSVCHQVVLAFLKFRKDCSTFLCLSWCPSRSSIGWNRSSVKPEESQKLPLKPVAVLNV